MGTGRARMGKMRTQTSVVSGRDRGKAGQGVGVGCIQWELTCDRGKAGQGVGVGCIEWELTCDGNRTCPNGEDEDPNFCRKSLKKI